MKQCPKSKHLRALPWPVLAGWFRYAEQKSAELNTNCWRKNLFLIFQNAHTNFQLKQIKVYANNFNQKDRLQI